MATNILFLLFFISSGNVLPMNPYAPRDSTGQTVDLDVSHSLNDALLKEFHEKYSYRELLFKYLEKNAPLQPAIREKERLDRLINKNLSLKTFNQQTKIKNEQTKTLNEQMKKNLIKKSNELKTLEGSLISRYKSSLEYCSSVFNDNNNQLDKERQNIQSKYFLIGVVVGILSAGLGYMAYQHNLQ